MMLRWIWQNVLTREDRLILPFISDESVLDFQHVLGAHVERALSRVCEQRTQRRNVILEEFASRTPFLYREGHQCCPYQAISTPVSTQWQLIVSWRHSVTAAVSTSVAVNTAISIAITQNGTSDERTLYAHSTLWYQYMTQHRSWMPTE